MALILSPCLCNVSDTSQGCSGGQWYDLWEKHIKGGLESTKQMLTLVFFYQMPSHYFSHSEVSYKVFLRQSNRTPASRIRKTAPTDAQRTWPWLRSSCMALSKCWASQDLFPHQKVWITNASQYFSQVIMRIKWTFSEIIKWKALLSLNLERGNSAWLPLRIFSHDLLPLLMENLTQKIFPMKSHSFIHSFNQSINKNFLNTCSMPRPSARCQASKIQSKSGQKILIDISPKKTYRWPISNEKMLHITNY